MLYRLFYNTFAKYPEHFNQPLTEVASGPQFTTGEFGLLLSSRRERQSAGPGTFFFFSTGRTLSKGTGTTHIGDTFSNMTGIMFSIFEPVYDRLSNLYQGLNPITIFGPV